MKIQPIGILLAVEINPKIFEQLFCFSYLPETLLKTDFISYWMYLFASFVLFPQDKRNKISLSFKEFKLTCTSFNENRIQRNIKIG